jgi:hypothetical protein
MACYGASITFILFFFYLQDRGSVRVISPKERGGGVVYSCCTNDRHIHTNTYSHLTLKMEAECSCET